MYNQLLHYVHFSGLEGVYVCPTPCDLALTSQSPAHQHLLYNFYAACLRIHQTFQIQTEQRKQVSAEVHMC